MDFIINEEIPIAIKKMNRWDIPDIPHKGWRCMDVYDVGQPDETCQMCGNERVRFIHLMRHPVYPNELSVGCVCAEKMSEDYIGPKKREKVLRNRARRRDNWLNRTWRVSNKGYEFLNVEGHNVVVFPRWRYRIDGKLSAKRFVTKDQAKLGAFDELWPAPRISEL